MIAQNGTLAIATNGATESVRNLGTFSIASASTLDVVPDMGEYERNSNDRGRRTNGWRGDQRGSQ